MTRKTLSPAPARLSSVVLVVFMVTGGCSFFRHSAPVVKEEVVSEVEEVKVLDHERFKKGGNLVVIPFNAGTSVEANDALDKVTLSLIKGLADKLQAAGSLFKILLAENIADADLAMKGYVTKLEDPGKIQRLMGKKMVSVVVEGKIVDQDTGKLVFVFKAGQDDLLAKDVYKKIGYAIGEKIAQEMLANKEN